MADAAGYDMEIDTRDPAPDADADPATCTAIVVRPPPGTHSAAYYASMIGGGRARAPAPVATPAADDSDSSDDDDTDSYEYSDSDGSSVCSCSDASSAGGGGGNARLVGRGAPYPPARRFCAACSHSLSDSDSGSSDGDSLVGAGLNAQSRATGAYMRRHGVSLRVASAAVRGRRRRAPPGGRASAAGSSRGAAIAAYMRQHGVSLPVASRALSRGGGAAAR